MSKRTLGWIIAILLVIIAALVLNPSAETHRSAIRAAVAERSPLAGMLGLGALQSLTVDYHSMGLVSYTTSDAHVISVGALGFVHVLKQPRQKKNP